jgi:hypothetical protein
MISMIHVSTLLRRPRSLAAAIVAAALAVLATFAFAVSGPATADHPHGARAVPPPPTNPTRADQIQNIDQVKTAIKGYYGDTTTSTPDPVDGKTTLHTFNPSGAYAHEMAGIVDKAEHVLAHSSGHGRHASHAKKAVLFDVDDTTLNTYSYEIYSNFVYNPTTNADFVNAAVFPAVPHMVALEHYAERKGYTVFFLTGRPEAQRAGTVTNLTNVGYDVNNANLYLKDLTAPWLSSCAATPCSTIQYKSLTRAHIESLGYDIVGNFGDQYSDLIGGYADKTFKLPNPMYYLP